VRQPLSQTDKVRDESDSIDDGDYYSDEEVERMGRKRRVQGLDTSISGSFRRGYIGCFVLVIVVLVLIVLFFS